MMTKFRGRLSLFLVSVSTLAIMAVVVEGKLPHGKNPIILEKMALAEIEFVGRLKAVLQEFKGKIKTLVTGCIQDFERDTGNMPGFYKMSAQGKAEAIVSNPISNFQMFYRYHENWSMDLPEQLFISKRELLQYVPKWKIFRKEATPAAMNLLLLIHVYDMRPDMVVDGLLLPGLDLGVSMTSAQCVEIAEVAAWHEIYSLSIVFFGLALGKSNDSQPHREAELHRQLRKVVSEHDQKVVSDAIQDIGNQYLFDRAIEPQLRKHGIEKSLPLLLERKFHKYEKQMEWEYPGLHTVCQLGTGQPPAYQRRLFCWYETKAHPYLRINPVKVERLSRNPDIVQFYDVIGNRALDKIKKLAVNTVDPPSFQNTFEYTHRPYPIVTVAEGQFPELRALPRLFEALTGLRVRGNSSSEELSVYADPPGGGTVAPFIPRNKTGLPGDDRIIAAITLFLAEPTIGGGAGFLRGRVHIKPVRGSAIFWYNLNRNGTEDPRTIHGRCPNLIGQQWIGVKTILYKDQFLNRKCGLKQKARNKIFP